VLQKEKEIYFDGADGSEDGSAAGSPKKSGKENAPSARDED
jgi:hypothetical protein